MASAPSERGPVRGRIDGQGKLVAADPELEALQVDAGSRIGAPLALPQVAAVARLARSLGIPVSRAAKAADKDSDLDLWVRAVPDKKGVQLLIERWERHPAAGPRLTAVPAPEAAAPQALPQDLEWAADRELKLTSVSPEFAELIGLKPDEIAGKPLTRVFRLEEDEHGEMPLLAAVAARDSFAGQPATPRSGDSPPRLLLSGEAAVDADGEFCGFTGRALSLDARPVSQSAAPSGQAYPIDAALDEALRSPLDRIIDAAEKIAGQGEGPLRSDYATYASDIMAAARHLLSVIDSTRQQDEIESDIIDLAALSAEAVLLLEAVAEQRGVSVVMEATRSLPAQGEERAVIQILVNIIGNAIRHSPAGGTVTLRFRRASEESCVTVLDEGTGIDPADQQRIFERFERARTDDGGTGLGLAISRRLARSMGGDIILESAPNEGARFTLSLPAAG